MLKPSEVGKRGGKTMVTIVSPQCHRLRALSDHLHMSMQAVVAALVDQEFAAQKLKDRDVDV